MASLVIFGMSSIIAPRYLIDCSKELCTLCFFLSVASSRSWSLSAYLLRHTYRPRALLPVIHPLLVLLGGPLKIALVENTIVAREISLSACGTCFHRARCTLDNNYSSEIGLYLFYSRTRTLNLPHKS